MSLARIHTVALSGLEAYPVEIEIDASNSEKFILAIVGLPDAAVRESKDRVVAAIKNSGYKRIEHYYCMVSLAPGDLKKEGSFYDLPMALGLIQAMKLGPKSPLCEMYIIAGELGLGGHLRPMRGALSAAILARDSGKKGILLPVQNAKEAAAVPGIDVIPVASLNDAINFFKDPKSIQPLKYENMATLSQKLPPAIDFQDIKGQCHVKRALEIAAAGGHNVILSGPPGSGKSMLAKAMIGIMPEMSLEEALEVTKIYSIAGLLKENVCLLQERPFRSPHHTVSYGGLIGGGGVPRPGEISLAHHGILFLDEMPEFSRNVLEMLRQPLEDRKVTISRANGNFTFPTQFICVGAMNPCPCGYLGHPDKRCKDTPLQIERYQNKLSGPLLDRIDMHIEVPALKFNELTAEPGVENSEIVRKRVQDARLLQHKRYGMVRINSQLTGKEIREHCPLDDNCKSLIKHAMDELGFSARAVDRLQRVARTIADLDKSEGIKPEHFLEAINFKRTSSKEIPF